METSEVKKEEGPKFETHTSDEMRQFTHGTHESQKASDENPVNTVKVPDEVVAPVVKAPEVKPGEDILSGLFPGDDPGDELTQLRTKLKAYEDKTIIVPLKNEKLYKLQVIESESPEEAPVFWQYLSGNLDSIALWKLGFLKDNPEYKDKPEDVQMYLEHKFPVLFDPNIDRTSTEYRIAKMDFDSESKKVRTSLDSRLNQIQIPKPEAPGEVSVQERSDLVSKWKPEFINLASEHDKVKIIVPVSDGVEEEIEFSVSAEVKRKVFEDAAMFVLSQKLPQGAESTQKVKDYMMSRTINYGFKEIAGLLIKQAVQKRDEAWKKATGNNVKIESVSTKVENVGTSQEDFVNRVLGKTNQRKQ